MPLINLLDFAQLIALIEFAGGAVIAAYAFVSLYVVLRFRDIRRARLLLIDGALLGLSVKVAASLLKTIQLHTWEQIAAFAVILVIRVALRAIFNWEKTKTV